MDQKELDEKFPVKEYNKKNFTFSKDELKELNPLEEATSLVNTFVILAQIAQRAKDNYVSSQVLNRLGVKLSMDTHSIYDIEKNTVTVYEPRLWCSKCDARKADVKYQEKIYCNTCITQLKEAEVKKLDAVQEVDAKEEPTEAQKPSDASQK